MDVNPRGAGPEQEQVQMVKITPSQLSHTRRKYISRLIHGYGIDNPVPVKPRDAPNSLVGNVLLKRMYKRQ